MNQKDSNNICFILDKNDAEIIYKKDLKKLSISILGQMMALSECEYIDNIYLGIVKNKNDSKESIFFKLLNLKLSKAIYLLIYNLSDIFFILHSRLMAQSKKELHLDGIDGFYNKLKGNFNLKQTKKDFLSFTYFSNEVDKNFFDFLIRGSGLLIEHGEILKDRSKFGLISLHHGDNRFNRGGPVGYWESIFKENSGITVQILTRELDGGKVIFRAQLNTLVNPLSNKEWILSHTYDVMSIALKKLYLSINKENDIKEFEENKFFNQPYCSSILKEPHPFKRLKHSILILLSIIPRKIFVLIFFISFQNKKSYKDGKWNVAITNNPNLRLSKWTSLENNDSKMQKVTNWHADPFIVKVENFTFLLTERFINANSKGEIWCNQIFNVNSTIKIGKSYCLLKNNHHLSYPFTFERRKKSYMIPENGENGCWLYQLLIKKDKGKIRLEALKIKKLIDGIILDPTLININGVDYIFASKGSKNYSDKVLRVWFSKDFINKSFEEHICSPLLLDNFFGRSAGRIFYDKNLKKFIRPSQVEGFSGYGEYVSYSEIYASPEIVSIVKRYENLKFKRNKLHHIDNIHGITAIDFFKKSLFF